MPTPLVTGLSLNGGPGLPEIAPPLKLKVLCDSAAQSATLIAGVVFNYPDGSDITGSKIGEFTAQTFDSSLEDGEAVLKVYCSDFGGGSLWLSDTPIVLVRNATYTTGLISATIVEE